MEDREIELANIAKSLHCSTLSEAMAIANHLDVGTAERLVQACLERGRPDGLLARIDLARERVVARGGASKTDGR